MGASKIAFSRTVVRAEKGKTEEERLKREDFIRVRHDNLFSEWKLLLGPEDWKNYDAGVEDGAHRYRLHNLPSNYFGPGVYELGLTVHQRVRKLRRKDVVVVYLGQADNVRQRLQRYGQTGSHLEGVRLGAVSSQGELEIPSDMFSKPEKVKVKSLVVDDKASEVGTVEVLNHGGPRLFTEAFEKGYYLHFRWAKTDSKQMAEKVEAELLSVFDYPWNRGSNGCRRRSDIMSKLEQMQCEVESSLCMGSALSITSRKFGYLRRKVGIVVAARKPVEEVIRTTTVSQFSTFMLKRRDAHEKRSESTGVPPVCGYVLETGSPCSSIPSEGCKRCSLHKGKRGGKRAVSARPHKPSKYVHDSQGTAIRPTVVTRTVTIKSKRVGLMDPVGSPEVCGIMLVSGLACVDKPARGRRRCTAHKGMRVKS